MDFINKFYNSLKNDSSDFTVTINKKNLRFVLTRKYSKASRN